MLSFMRSCVEQSNNESYVRKQRHPNR